MSNDNLKARLCGDRVVLAQDKILLDECVMSSSKNRKMADSTGVYQCSTDVLGQGAPDDQVMQFAKTNNYLLVTQDTRFVIKCIANGVPVAYYDKKINKALVIQIPQVIDLPIRVTQGAPFKFYMTYRLTKGAPIKVKQPAKPMPKPMSFCFRLRQALVKWAKVKARMRF